MALASLEQRRRAGWVLSRAGEMISFAMPAHLDAESNGKKDDARCVGVQTPAAY